MGESLSGRLLGWVGGRVGAAPAAEAGVAPAAFTCTVETRLCIDADSVKVVEAALASHHAGVCWSVAANQAKHLVPSGAVVYLAKQVVVPANGEVRV